MCGFKYKKNIRGKAWHLIEAGAVSINEAKITDPQAKIELMPGTLVRVGKHRFYRLK